ncbi:hypothetical protein [Streptomyces sp. NPDC006691]|uniref:hypothetical protein n=1 Tax=Streptomyces sp. NPDC006691 TaxID=3364757 RepID=UPI0036B77720
MHILVGIVLLAFGLAFAVFAPTMADSVGTRAGRVFARSNAVAFRVIGGLVALAGLLYACGVIG